MSKVIKQTSKVVYLISKVIGQISNVIGPMSKAIQQFRGILYCCLAFGWQTDTVQPKF